MKNKKTIIILSGLLVLLLGGASVLYNKLSDKVESPQLADQKPQTTQTASDSSSDNSSEQSAEKIVAPDFTVYDIDGNPVHLSDFKGKPVVLNFWASWCGPCKMEMPDFNEKYLELGEDINFIMVNSTDGSRETVEIASEFIKSTGYSFPVYYDNDSDASMKYGVYSLPTTFFIDADGNFVTYATGAISGDILQKGINMIYSK
ncbi:MAG: TlpA family protein disulfide reductase [Ruminococcus sp.]|nr:TlpA family protein disulfide reductase [Ruminococcus sp.]